MWFGRIFYGRRIFGGSPKIFLNYKIASVFPKNFISIGGKVLKRTMGYNPPKTHTHTHTHTLVFLGGEVLVIVDLIRIHFSLFRASGV